jgi:NADPH2:quinone reductase
MRAIRVHAFGGPEALSLEDVPAPVPGEGQALVQVAAAGVNFIDVYQRTGLYPNPLPFGLGLEGAGVVERVGPGVADLAPGDRVAWASGAGSYAEEVVVAAERLVPVPAGVPLETAAASMLQGMTADYLVRATFPLGPGKTALLHAAAGGVGLLLCQMARALGARVIGTASSDEKCALARAAGAEHVIRYDREDFAAEARRWTGGRGVDVVYDSVGATTWRGSLDALASRGTAVFFGQSSGRVPPLELLELMKRGSLYATRCALADYTSTREELLERAGRVLDAVAAGRLSVRIGAEFPLSRAADAHRALERRATSGKVLLRTDG